MKLVAMIKDFLVNHPEEMEIDPQTSAPNWAKGYDPKKNLSEAENENLSPSPKNSESSENESDKKGLGAPTPKNSESSENLGLGAPTPKNSESSTSENDEDSIPSENLGLGAPTPKNSESSEKDEDSKHSEKDEVSESSENVEDSKHSEKDKVSESSEKDEDSKHSEKVQKNVQKDSKPSEKKVKQTALNFSKSAEKVKFSKSKFYIVQCYPTGYRLSSAIKPCKKNESIVAQYTVDNADEFKMEIGRRTKINRPHHFYEDKLEFVKDAILQLQAEQSPKNDEE